MLQLPEAPSRACKPACVTTAIDQKVIDAGKKFETLLTQEYLPVNAEWRRLYQATWTTMEKKFGSFFRAAPADSPEWKFFRRASKANGYNAASSRQSDIHTELDRLAEIIRSVQPRTIVTLRTHFLIAFFECQPLGAGDASEDFGNLSFGDEVAHEHLFDAVAAFVGIARSKMTFRGAR